MFNTPGQPQPIEDSGQLENEVLDTMGGGPLHEEGAMEHEAEPEVPTHIKKKLGMQEKRHRKEMRGLQEQLSAMQQMREQMQPEQQQPMHQGYSQHFADGEDMRIQKAVQMALSHKDQQERQAKDAERAAHVHKSYQKLQDHLDDVSQDYEDFDDIVRAPDAKYTEAMRDAALMLPNAGHVLYKLGKDRNELNRIAQLHPLEQAKEMVKLSHAAMMMSNKESRPQTQSLSDLKSNPSRASDRGPVSDKTSISELRRRLKTNWK